MTVPLRRIKKFSFCAGIFKQAFGARNRVGIGLLYHPAIAGILKQSVEARNRVGIGLSYHPTIAGIFKQSMGLGTE
jgi:hypothetical protein